MKVLALNGSPRTDGNTSILIDTVMRELESEGIETEIYNLAGKKLGGCIACYQCAQNQDKRCAVKNDDMNEVIEKMLEADGIILASPTYFANCSTEIKAVIDRAGLVAKVNGDMFQRKVGASVVAVRRAGSVHVFNSMNFFFFINQMVVPGSDYWNMAIGMDKGEVSGDEEGMMTMKVLGRNMAWLMKKIC